MRKFVLAALFASTLLAPTLANAQARTNNAVYSQCGYDDDAAIYGVGTAAGLEATPILLAFEKQALTKGDHSAMLRSIPVRATTVQGWTADYAMMRLSQTAGHPIWALTENGQPGDMISVDIPSTNLADAYDRIAAAKGKRWMYDGDKVYLLGGREWTMPLPSNHDLSLAIQDAITRNGIRASIEGSVIRFQADNAGVEQVRSVVNQVYSQARLNPYDVKFYKVYPTSGAVDWSSLVERTDAIESVTFQGKTGAAMVMDPTAGDVVETFLAREGQVVDLGSTTMVASQPDAGSAHSAGCGAKAIGSRGLKLAGGAFERGRMSLSYTILGASSPETGRLVVAPGSVVVLADAVPDQGGYMVAVIRPRVLELQGGTTAAPVQPQPQAPQPGFDTRQVAQNLLGQ